MKNFAIRVTTVVAFALLLIAPGGEFGPIGGLAWDVILSVAFAYVAMFVAGASVFFVVSVVILLTVAFPLAVLLAVGYPSYHSIAQTAAVLMASLFKQPFQSALQFGLPAVVVAGIARLFSHRALAQRPRRQAQHP